MASGDPGVQRSRGAVLDDQWVSPFSISLTFVPQHHPVRLSGPWGCFCLEQWPDCNFAVYPPLFPYAIDTLSSCEALGLCHTQILPSQGQHRPTYDSVARPGDARRGRAGKVCGACRVAVEKLA